MFPFHPHIGSFEIPVHGIVEVVAYSASFKYYLWLKSSQGDSIEWGSRLSILVGTVAGAFIGSRLVGIFEKPGELFATTNILVYIIANKTIVGGLAGGLIGTELVKKRIGVTLSSGDLITFPIMLGMIIGRLGCFLEGLEDGTYGVATMLPWGIDFGDGVMRHPTQLYEILFLLILWSSLIITESKTLLSNGARFKVFLASYFFFRLLVDFIKPTMPVLFGLATIQWVCIAGLLYYWRVFAKPQSLLMRPAFDQVT